MQPPAMLHRPRGADCCAFPAARKMLRLHRSQFYIRAGSGQDGGCVARMAIAFEMRSEVKGPDSEHGRKEGFVTGHDLSRALLQSALNLHS
jgi:hypothetical protein